MVCCPYGLEVELKIARLFSKRDIPRVKSLRSLIFKWSTCLWCCMVSCSEDIWLVLSLKRAPPQSSLSFSGVETPWGEERDSVEWVDAYNTNPVEVIHYIISSFVFISAELFTDDGRACCCFKEMKTRKQINRKVRLSKSVHKIKHKTETWYHSLTAL